MVDRRRFVQSTLALGAALAAWPAGGVSVRRACASAGASLVLVDRLLAGSTSFAADARSRGVDTREFAGDPAGLWMLVIEPRLRAGPVTIAGYTSAATLFCLDLLARDYGARTVERVDGAATSWIIASSPGRRAPLAPAGVRARSGEFHA